MKGKRIHKVIDDFKPYFYVLEDEPVPVDDCIISVDGVRQRALTGERVKKITVKLPSDVKKLRDYFAETFEADCLFTERYLIDNHYKIKKTPLRTCYFDIETDTKFGDPFPKADKIPILIISTYDSFSKKYTTFYNKDSEQKIIMDFIKYVIRNDFDVITAYNISFDLPYVIERCKWLGIPYQYLSPIKNVYVGDYDVNIGGRSTLDFLGAYKNLHYGELRSFALANVAKSELDEKLWKLDDPRKLAGDLSESELKEYNVRDVEIMVELDKKLGIIDFYYELQILASSQLQYTTWYSALIDNLILQDKTYILPTKTDHQYEMFKGAIVTDPIAGIHNNVAVYDFSALYPNIIINFNMSPDTICDESYEGEKYEVGNGVYFKKEPVGLLPKTFKKLIALRDYYKRERDYWKIGTPNYKLYDDKQYVTKFLVNALYGVSNFRRFRLNNPLVGASTTYIGRELSLWVHDGISLPVVFADTDSSAVKVSKFSECTVVLERFNKLINEYKDNKKITGDFPIKMDEFYSRLLLTDAKKRRAGLITYKNDRVVDPPELEIVGLDCRRSDQAEIVVDIQEELIGMLLKSDDVTIDDIRTLVKKYYNKINNDNLDYIAIAKNFTKPWSHYKVRNLYHKGFKWCQDKHGVQGFVSKHLYVYTIANEDSITALPVDIGLPGDVIKIDVKKIYTNLVLKKIEKLLTTIDFTLKDIEK